jgi:hypothetical protein
MSEEERKKDIPIAYRIISIIALFVGIATFLSGLLFVLALLWNRIIPGAGGDFVSLGMFLKLETFLSYVFWPSAVIGLVLSIVTLFVERNLCFRLLPLAFIIVGICLYELVYVIAFLWFIGG